MLYVCMMVVVFSVCILTARAVGGRVMEYECFVVQRLYVCVLCASCGNSQCYILHDLQFLNCLSRMQGATIWK